MNEAVRQLRSAADCVESLAVPDDMLDVIELIAHHIKDKVQHGMADRKRVTELMLRILDRA